MMWLLSQFHLVALLSYLTLSLYVLLQNPDNRLNRSCALFLFFLAIWSFEKVARSAPGITREQAWFWCDICNVAWIGLPAAFLWFFLVLTGRSRQPRCRWLLRLALTVGAVLLVAQSRHLLVSDLIRTPYGFIYSRSGRPWLWIFFIYYLFIIFSGLAALLGASVSPP